MPILGRAYPLVDVAEGVRHVEQGHARGKLVVTVPWGRPPMCQGGRVRGSGPRLSPRAHAGTS
jgi:hypothetical protein